MSNAAVPVRRPLGLELAWRMELGRYRCSCVSTRGPTVLYALRRLGLGLGCLRGCLHTAPLTPQQVSGGRVTYWIIVGRAIVSSLATMASAFSRVKPAGGITGTHSHATSEAFTASAGHLAGPSASAFKHSLGCPSRRRSRAQQRGRVRAVIHHPRRDKAHAPALASAAGEVRADLLGLQRALQQELAHGGCTRAHADCSVGSVAGGAGQCMGGTASHSTYS